METATVRKRGAARLRSGHPWVYRSDVAEASGEAGDVVRVADRAGRSLGQAFYNPRSEISLRLVTRGEEPVDRAFVRSRIEEALAYRDSLSIDADAYRLLHAEADGLPGLVVDRYGPYLVLQVGSAAVERRLDWVLEALGELAGPEGVLLRGDVASRKREGLDTGVRVLAGEVPESVVVREGPVRYRADLFGGQKTGAFLDQRENRAAAGGYASGRVLDVFSHTGGFALHAALGVPGGTSVEAVDSSGPALEAARANAALNGLENVTCTRANAFDLLRERSDAGERYGLVVLDPPAFARTRRDLPAARRAYKEINLRAMKLLEPGGVLFTCSCSYHFSRELMEETLREAASDAGRRARVLEWRGQSLDHPEILTVPETRYLKCAVLQCP
ncbi:MAG: class I SAM-dependent rRNA methyltransferase [Rubrobacter sp.]|nr:class I SAM-dependent rRNA methyltransferase [Rubrobacter sp.]